jgi:hypothetical protein
MTTLDIICQRCGPVLNSTNLGVRTCVECQLYCCRYCIAGASATQAGAHVCHDCRRKGK